MPQTERLPAPESRRVRIGLVGVGPGSIAQRVHIPSLRRIPEADIVAVATRSGTVVAQAGALYRDCAEMLDAEQLDVLYVMTPTVAHPGCVMAALERGVHVFCEKPPALTVTETKAMVEAAQGKGLSLLFGFNRRFAPSYVRMRQLAAERGCHTLILHKTRAWTEPVNGQTMAAADESWRRQATLAGGPIFEFVTHLFDLALWVNGPVRGQRCSVRRLYGSSVNLSAVGYLEHENGARSVVVYEQVSGQDAERVTMHGPGISAEVVGGTFARNELEVHERGTTQAFAGPPDLLEGGGFLPMSQHLVRTVARGEVVRSDLADAIEAVRLAAEFDPLRPTTAEAGRAL